MKIEDPGQINLDFIINSQFVILNCYSPITNHGSSLHIKYNSYFYLLTGLVNRKSVIGRCLDLCIKGVDLRVKDGPCQSGFQIVVPDFQVCDLTWKKTLGLFHVNDLVEKLNEEAGQGSSLDTDLSGEGLITSRKF